ncbi:MAG: Rid family detoxifying hydrolase [Candidatus Gracilibacteria bacterium]|nr:Rid family detoxifying hydrolase [Candidatus Gracilibacteria bacterium]
MGLIFSNRKEAVELSNNKNETINDLFKTNKSPKAIGPYSKAYFAGDLLFCSGQLGFNGDTMEIVEGGIENQTRQACRNISYLLEENGLGLKDVVKTTIFLKNLNDFEKVNDIYKNYFILKPARSTVEVSRLPKDALIEIEVIAMR